MKQNVEKGNGHHPEQEKHFQAIFEQTAVGVILVESTTGKYLRANKKYCNIVGYSEEELQNMDFQSITHPDDCKSDSDYFERLISGEIREFSKDKRYIRKNGDIVWVNGTVSAMWNPGEQPSYHITVIQDITESKRREEETRLNSEIFKNVSEGIYLLGMEDGVIKHCNSKFEQMFGYRPGEMIGKDVSILNASTDKTPQETKVDILDLLRKNGEWHGEIQNIRKDGTLFWSYANVSKFDHHHYGRVIVSVHTDITERKKAERELHESNERFHSLVEFSPYGIDIHSDGKLLFVNPEAAKILGAKNPEDLIGKPIFELLHPDYHEVVMKRIQMQEKGMTAPLLEEKFIRMDGTPVEVELMSSSIIYKGKLAFYNVFHDITQRKRSEEALRESDAKYRELFDNAQVGMYRTKIDGSAILEINKYMCEMLGAPKEVLLNEQSIIHWANIEDRHKILGILKEKGSVENYEAEILKRNGGRFSGLISMKLHLSEGYIEGSIIDVTQRKKAEQALLQSEKKFRDLVDTALVGVYITNTKGELLYANETVAKMFEFDSSEEMISSGAVVRYNNKKDREILIKRLKKTGKVLNFEFEGITKKGNIKNILLSATLSGEILTGMVMDITRRKRAEEKLRESDDRLKDIFDNANDAIVTTDLKGKVLSWNKAAEKLFGFTEYEVIGKELTSLIVPENVMEERLKMIIKALSGITFTGIETIRKRKDGTKICVSVNISPIHNADKKVIGLCGIIRDITEHKKVEKLRIENDHLAVANKTKSNFLAQMSHELRTPLNAIIGFSDLMKLGLAGEINEKQKHYLENIHNGGKHLLDIINDILDLTKVESGKLELSIEKIPVLQIINGIFVVLNETALKSNVILKQELDPGLEFIEADNLRFKQILFNLLSNAVKFNKPEGGTVTLTSKKQKDMAIFSVSDTGIGIKEEDMKKLFREFEQIDSGSSRKYGGTGLGLAITKHLVELHGGRIWVESKYEEGSTFIFMLPLKAKKEGK